MASKIVYRIIKVPGIAILRIFDWLVGSFASSKDVFLAEDYFPFRDVLRDNRMVFLGEYFALQGEKELNSIKDFYTVETDLLPDNNWKAAPIVLFGHRFKENAERCPETFRIISQIPGCSAAMFSVVGPGKHIPPHKGIYKGIYRCLLTLKVQENADCWIRVNNKKLFFREGECIVFDETAEHEVVNASSMPRIVLYLDFYRRLPFPINVLNAILFRLLCQSYFVSNIFDQHSRLEKTSLEVFTAKKAIGF